MQESSSFCYNKTAFIENANLSSVRNIIMNQKHTAIYLKILLFFAFICLLGWSIFLIREKLLSNAKDMGIHLAQSYADEEEN